MIARVEALIERPEDAVIAVVGGTGDQGRGLALRWARAGQEVVLGSRDEARAAAAAASVGHGVRGAKNAEAVKAADVVVLAVPWEAHESTLLELRSMLNSRLLVDCVNPLGFDKQGPFALEVDAGSATQQAADLLPETMVVGAFHHLSAELLLDESVPSIDSDVMVLGDVRAAVDLVIVLAGRIPGVRGVYAGRLRNAHQVEGLTANLIATNRRYQTRSGIRVTGR